MGRYKDFREPRRGTRGDEFPAERGMAGGFDAPSHAPAAASGPTVEATVKWFNPEKGFGFVEITDGSGDVFMHARALEAAGHSAVSPGATLTVRVGPGQKGRQVTEVISVDESTAAAQPARAPRSGGFGGRDSGGFGREQGGGGGYSRDSGGGRDAGGFGRDTGPTEDVIGTVKWYNPEKGFGFIAPEGGAKDVFVHVTALRRSRLDVLAEGQRVRVSIGQGPKGPEARFVEPLD